MATIRVLSLSSNNPMGRWQELRRLVEEELGHGLEAVSTGTAGSIPTTLPGLSEIRSADAYLISSPFEFAGGLPELTARLLFAEMERGKRVLIVTGPPGDHPPATPIEFMSRLGVRLDDDYREPKAAHLLHEVDLPDGLEWTGPLRGMATPLRVHQAWPVFIESDLAHPCLVVARPQPLTAPNEEVEVQMDRAFVRLDTEPATFVTPDEVCAVSLSSIPGAPPSVIVLGIPCLGDAFVRENREFVEGLVGWLVEGEGREEVRRRAVELVVRIETALVYCVEGLLRRNAAADDGPGIALDMSQGWLSLTGEDKRNQLDSGEKSDLPLSAVLGLSDICNAIARNDYIRDWFGWSGRQAPEKFGRDLTVLRNRAAHPSRYRWQPISDEELAWLQDQERRVDKVWTEIWSESSEPSSRPFSGGTRRPGRD